MRSVFMRVGISGSTLVARGPNIFCSAFRHPGYAGITAFPWLAFFISLRDATESAVCLKGLVPCGMIGNVFQNV